MTAQEIFDTVVNHAASMRWKAQDKYGNCRYRTEDGDKCFVGKLLTDEEAAIASSGDTVWLMHEKGILPERLVPYLLLLEDLQQVHDCGSMREWPRQLRNAARKFHLDAASVETAFF